jgi:hypothetical protein
MLQALLHRPLLVLNQAADHPLDKLAALQENHYSCIEATNTVGYVVDMNWEGALQRRLGIS